MRWYLVAFLICTALDVFKITCEVTCKADGDQFGIAIDGKCICGNERDVSKYVFKFDSQKLKGRTVNTPPPALPYWQQ